MKVIKVLFVSLMCLVNLVGCGSKDGLDKYRYSGQLVDLNYEVFDEKLTNNESFIFFVTREGCHACESFYTTTAEFLDENEDKIIYTISESDIDSIGVVVMISYFTEALGKDYYFDNDYSTTVLYTPSIGKVVNGEFVYANIGGLNKEELGFLYQDNYYSLDTYYSYNRKVQKKEKFNLFVSLDEDKQYDKMLRNYFLENSNYNASYLNATNFDESEETRLLDRINYFLGEENSIEALPSYFLLQYEDGKLINYIEGQFDVSSLDNLYNK